MGMALPAPVAGNVLQTQINILAWALKARRKANHTKLIALIKKISMNGVKM